MHNSTYKSAAYYQKLFFRCATHFLSPGFTYTEVGVVHFSAISPAMIPNATTKV